MDTIEPYNISVEDLDRPGNAPDNWLKIGSYRDFGQIKMVEYDLFADVDRACVYSLVRKSESSLPVQTWNSIDDCLCGLFDVIYHRILNAGNG